MNKFESVKELSKQYREMLGSITKEDVHGLFKEAFEKHPELRVITWNQYTPSFNDGDPCVFRRGEWYAATTAFLESCESGTTDKDIESLSVRDLYDSVVVPEMENDIEKIFSSLSKSVCETVLGNNRQVIVTRNGLTLRDYYC